MNKQEIFNIVYTHLLKQGVKAIIDEGGAGEICAYRGPNGTKCAAGVLIPDEVYNLDMEGELIKHVIEKFSLVHLRLETSFVQELQFVHDNNSPDLWQNELQKLADAHSLTIPEIN